jgi:hypothetical protein
MKGNRSFWINTMVAVLLGTCLSTGAAGDQHVYKGKFTLPVTARWGQAVLPAGDYTFTLDTTSLPAVASVQDRDRNVRLVLATSKDRSSSAHSHMVLLRNGAGNQIITLDLAELGVVFHYVPPKAEGQLLAQVPEFIQRIPISASGK